MMSLHRLFAAIRPPAATRQALTAAMGGISGARWQDDSQLHCTLRFIGEVDRHRAEDVAAALGGVRHPPLMLELGPAGVFESKGQINALWLGLLPRDALRTLHDRIDRALCAVGIALDERAFLPHITIARFGRRDAPPSDVAARVPALVSHRFEARYFELMESHLGSEGARYETVSRYPLT